MHGDSRRRSASSGEEDGRVDNSSDDKHCNQVQGMCNEVAELMARQLDSDGLMSTNFAIDSRRPAMEQEEEKRMVAASARLL